MRLLPAGSDALLVEVDDLDQALALFASLRGDPVEGVEELVPAARTVLLRYRPSATTLERLAAAVRSRPLTAGAVEPGPLVRIPVHYDGEDLPDVARTCGLSEAEVVRRHTAATYSVAFTGFAPGFAYLAGGDPALRVPRRSSPRTAIPAGAVALAGEFSGVYPRASPGGWQLVGRTDVAMWDLSREEPALLQPGARVRFEDAGADGGPSGPAAPEAASGPAREPDAEPDAERERGLVVLRPGALTVLEDLGRPGRSGLGVSRSGALDPGSLRRANHLVGNPAGAPALEVASGGLAVRALGDLVVAVTGAPAPLVVRSPRGDRAVPVEQPLAVDDGEVLELGAPPRGVCSYLAVRGSFAVAPVLGSTSRDVLAGIGPEPLRAGDVLAIGGARPVAAVALDAGAAPVLPSADDVVVLDVVLGPREDWFTPGALDVLTGQDWTVTPQSNRVGLRLRGASPLERSRDDELPSEATGAGALQVPPSGQPVLFMADHPVTGGYPVIGCVAAHHLGLAAQVPVGGRLRFRVLAHPPGEVSA